MLIKEKKKAVFIPTLKASLRGAFFDIIEILTILDFDIIIISCSEEQRNLPIGASILSPMLFKKIIDMKMSRTGEILIEQLAVSGYLLLLSARCSVIFISHALMPLPAFLARLLGKRVYIISGGIGYASIRKELSTLRFVTMCMEFLQYSFSNRIVSVSQRLLSVKPLNSFVSKTSVAPFRLIDQRFFRRFRYHDLTGRANIIGYIGRFDWEKGFDIFVESIPAILSLSSNYKILIIGDGPLRNLLDPILSDFSLRERIIVLNWRKDIENYLPIMKLLILPSRTEGLPSTIIEAMACGTPVMATAVGDIPELIKDAETGFLLTNLTSAEIVRNIQRILENEETMKTATSKAYQKILEKYDLNKILRLWSEALQEPTKE